ncbi:MAG: FHA domain-containing protein [Xanthomonadales bacterium]|nr:FHA domain-containing protein [Xanthomonadales bacterium]
MSNSASPAVPTDLGQMDLTVLDELSTLQAELEQLDSRLKSMDGRREAVAEEVFNRVRRDYLSQRQMLVEKAEPLRQQARSLYTKVKAVLIELESALSTVQMDLEEIDFRHSLGEYEDAERDRRKKAKAATLKERKGALDEAQAIAARFAKAFPGVEKEATTLPSLPPVSESEDPTKRVKKVEEDEIRTAELPSPEDSSQPPEAPLSAVPPAPPAPPVAPSAPPPRRNPDATVVFRPARLLDQASDQPSGPYTLGLKPLSFGSDARCDVQIEGVAPRQAEVGPSRSGFILRDLAGRVTKVNGQPVEEQLLADGDVIQIGSLSLKFSQI